MLNPCRTAAALFITAEVATAAFPAAKVLECCAREREIKDYLAERTELPHPLLN